MNKSKKLYGLYDIDGKLQIWSVRKSEKDCFRSFFKKTEHWKEYNESGWICREIIINELHMTGVIHTTMVGNTRIIYTYKDTDRDSFTDENYQYIKGYLEDGFVCRDLCSKFGNNKFDNGWWRIADLTEYGFNPVNLKFANLDSDDMTTIIEFCTELAENRLLSYHQVDIDEVGSFDVETDCFRYFDNYQDDFNKFYDEYEAKLLNTISNRRLVI